MGRVRLSAEGLVGKEKKPAFLFRKRKNPSNSSIAISIPKRIRNILDAKQGGFIFFLNGWVRTLFIPSLRAPRSPGLFLTMSFTRSVAPAASPCLSERRLFPGAGCFLW